MKLVENNVVAMFRQDEYLIEICKEECQGIESWDAYLQKDGYGIKMGMFGMAVRDCTLEEFIALVEENIYHHIEIDEEEGYGT